VRDSGNSHGSDELQPWQAARIDEAVPPAQRHSIHSYFVSCPESPDGNHVLYFASRDPSGESGEICVLNRETRADRVLRSGVTTEDAHRAACQQWVAGGHTVVYHDWREGEWLVAAMDLAGGPERILARKRQVGFGAPHEVWVPIYGSHWKQGEHRDLELVHVGTGEIRTVLTIREVLESFGPEVERLVGDGATSIFFPVMSPDGRKVFFKIARGHGRDDFRSSEASERRGKWVYDLETRRCLRFFEEWSHPSWSPDAKGIFEKGNVLFDLVTGKVRSFAPDAPTDHPSLSPAGGVFVTDADMSRREGGRSGEWGIVIGSLATGAWSTIHRFDNSRGAKSWRHNHPHPVFSADGRRIYYNVNDGPWTRLMHAEAGDLSE